MKKLMFLALFPMQAFSSLVVIDYDAFEDNLDDRIYALEDCVDLLTDSFDIYTYYWLQGKISGLQEAREVLDQSITQR